MHYIPWDVKLRAMCCLTLLFAEGESCAEVRLPALISDNGHPARVKSASSAREYTVKVLQSV